MVGATLVDRNRNIHQLFVQGFDEACLAGEEVDAIEAGSPSDDQGSKRVVVYRDAILLRRVDVEADWRIDVDSELTRRRQRTGIRRRLNDDLIQRGVDIEKR